eukprot:TRINITY_DN500_c2_g1_i1.p1 TRINITY_DN500_c2_g1~~TRINITY_DN500_c2_g1_i1.p1  ORF type:complete len:308 (-),score=97.49 TRINITY_DN500_c2_g1_i1:35-958(-)
MQTQNNPIYLQDTITREREAQICQRYQRVQRLSEGSTAIVWKATDLKTKRTVALKIAQDSASISNLSLFFKQEAKALKKFDHPNIITVFETSPRHISMELMPNCLFEHVLRNQQLPQPIVLDLFSQIVKALKYIHSKGYCHRDIKLENILLNKDCTSIKLADFGFATRCSNKMITDLFPGSPDYISPEVANKLPYDGMAYDIWSCGVTLYAMASRRFPFSRSNDTNKVVLQRIREFKTLELRMEFPGDVAKLLQKILVKNPTDRPRARDLLQDEILQPYTFNLKNSSPETRRKIGSPIALLKGILKK